MSYSQGKNDTYLNYICCLYDPFPDTDIKQKNMNVSKNMLRIFAARSKEKNENTEPQTKMPLFF